MAVLIQNFISFSTWESKSLPDAVDLQPNTDAINRVVHMFRSRQRFHHRKRRVMVTPSHPICQSVRAWQEVYYPMKGRLMPSFGGHFRDTVVNISSRMHACLLGMNTYFWQKSIYCTSDLSSWLYHGALLQPDNPAQRYHLHTYHRWLKSDNKCGDGNSIAAVLDRRSTAVFIGRGPCGTVYFKNNSLVVYRGNSLLRHNAVQYGCHLHRSSSEPHSAHRNDLRDHIPLIDRKSNHVEAQKSSTTKVMLQVEGLDTKTHPVQHHKEIHVIQGDILQVVNTQDLKWKRLCDQFYVKYLALW